MRLIAFIPLAMSLAFPSAAREVLVCKDIDRVGFSWKNDGSVARAVWPPSSFRVIILSETKRQIKLANDPVRYNYNCVKGRNNKILCVEDLVPSHYPVIFQGQNFERVINNSKHIGGDPQLAVAYGTCTKR